MHFRNCEKREMFSRVHYFATSANLLSGRRFRSKSTHGQHLAWSMHLGICSHVVGIYSHTMLIIHTLLVIDTFPSLEHSCPALGMQHDRLPSRSSRSLSNWEVRSPLGRLLRVPTYKACLHHHGNDFFVWLIVRRLRASLH